MSQKEPRRLIQITTYRDRLFALCNDGSIFEYDAGFADTEACWHECIFPPIPQEAE